MKPSRMYASFFDWPRKLVKEQGILRTFHEALLAAGENAFQSFTPSKTDPPDCTAIDGGGDKVGIEITELVSEEAIRRNLDGDAVYRDWEQEQVIEALECIIRRKDQKCSNVSGFSRLLLLIHTDEPVIDYEVYQSVLENHAFQKPHRFDEVVLLFSYDPRRETYPYVRLRFQALPGQNNIARR
jgi:hypothetical protein